MSKRNYEPDDAAKVHESSNAQDRPLGWRRFEGERGEGEQHAHERQERRHQHATVA